MRRLLVGFGVVCGLMFVAEPVRGIPYFARKYNVSCARCHSVPPKLNEFGERFVANGYRAEGLEGGRTIPLAVWLSLRSESLAGDQTDDGYKGYPNRLEVISGDAVTSWLSYFVEWRALSKESRANGTLRDRSGRFEDIFVTLRRGGAELMVGQFRQIGQVDVSRRLSLSEPLVLSSGVGGKGTGSSREIGLRGFSSSGRSPALRASWTAELRPGTRWVTAVGIPFAGELSIPLTDSAKVQASNELELDVKGWLLESYVRRGLVSAGGHVFYDTGERYLVTGILTASREWLHGTATAGVLRSGAPTRKRWSVEAEAIPHRFVGVGARLEDQFDDDVPKALLPHLNVHFPGTRFTVRLTLEQRIQRDRNATLLEVGTVF